ncbi:hypothetical protein B0H21DRAFT_820304 [Amylocystis lapponica]|nr:hypothetical protein B0H21DRAFT_820304 [Amylocystis lapponica]
MVIEKLPLPDEGTPTDAPPAYDALEPAASSTSPQLRSQVEKNAPPPSLSAQAAAASRQITKGNRTWWFAFGPSARTTREIKATVLALVRDLVKQPDLSGAPSILHSCAEACHAHGLSFPALLQEPAMEGHSPIYWAVIKRAADADGQDLVAALLALAAPLSEDSLSEIRLACLQNSDNTLFQRLRRSPAVAPLTGTDELLLGASVPPDAVDVQDVPGDEGAFVVHIRIPVFQRRMRVSGEVNMEFIARGRLWALSFLVLASSHDVRVPHQRHPPGTWLVALALLEHSPPTWIDSRLIIEEPADAPPAHPKPRPKPTISLRLTRPAQLTAPAYRGRRNDAIVVSLGDSLMANSLQYNGSSYLGADECLHARLEARLAKPDGAECIIC